VIDVIVAVVIGALVLLILGIVMSAIVVASGYDAQRRRNEQLLEELLDQAKEQHEPLVFVRRRKP
jgi:Flp pilus assembly protein TadB